MQIIKHQLQKSKNFSPIGVLGAKFKLNNAKKNLNNNPDTFSDIVDIQGQKKVVNKNKTYISTLADGKNLVEYTKTGQGTTKTIENTSDGTIIVTKYKNNGDELEIKSIKMSDCGKYN